MKGTKHKNRFVVYQVSAGLDGKNFKKSFLMQNEVKILFTISLYHVNLYNFFITKVCLLCSRVSNVH